MAILTKMPEGERIIVNGLVIRPTVGAGRIIRLVIEPQFGMECELQRSCDGAVILLAKQAAVIDCDSQARPEAGKPV